MALVFRFDPPRFDLGTDLGWVLRRAFAPPEARADANTGLDAESILELAETLDLTARIGARTPKQDLIHEVGEEAAGAILAAHRQVAARSLVVEQLCREASGVGRELDIPLVFLKGAALLLAGRLPTGSRGMTDIDVMVPRADAIRLQQRLKERGWVEMPGPSGEHQLQMLAHRSGLGLEIHTMVLGVRIGGTESASADELLAEGLLVRVKGLPDGSSIPADPVLLAHLLVHGIAQHGLKPGSYPMSRLIADAQDLCGEPARWDDLLPEAMGWIGSDVTTEEAEAVRTLALRLRGGKDPAAIAGADDRPGRLLRHIVAGTLDKSYRDGLRLRALASPVAGRSPTATIVRNVFRTVWLTRPQVDILYGTPGTTLGYWGWRLWRPFDLVLRTVRYGWAWLRFFLRGR